MEKLYSQVKNVSQELESIIGLKGKRKAQQIAEEIIVREGLFYSKGCRPSYTHYYLSNDRKSGSISLFISYKGDGKLKDIKIY